MSGLRVQAAAALVALAACSLGTDAPDKPTSARVRVEGTTPHPLLLVTATDFYEQIDPSSGATTAVANRADTTEIALPFESTIDLTATGSVYVELRNLLEPVASVRLRVELDNGKGYDRSATLSDDAALIYYYVTNDYTSG